MGPSLWCHIGGLESSSKHPSLLISCEARTVDIWHATEYQYPSWVSFAKNYESYYLPSSGHGKRASFLGWFRHIAQDPTPLIGVSGAHIAGWLTLKGSPSKKKGKGHRWTTGSRPEAQCLGLSAAPLHLSGAPPKHRAKEPAEAGASQGPTTCQGTHELHHFVHRHIHR